MNNSPLITIIIASYNHALFIRECISSAIKQTYSNLELIIIDDGSSDESWQIIKEMQTAYKNRFKNIICRKDKHSGLSSVLNKLVYLANGEYIFFLASDDVMYESCIETLYGFFKSDTRTVLSVSDNHIVNENNELIAWDIQQNITKFNSGYNTFWTFLINKHKRLREIDIDLAKFGSYKTLIKGNYIPNGYLVRKSALKTIVFTDNAPMEDWYLHLHLSRLGTYCFTREILFAYRWHKNNTIKIYKAKNKIKIRRTKICFFLQQAKKLFFR